MTTMPISWRRPHLLAWRRAGLPLPELIRQWLDLGPELEWQVPHPAVSIWAEDNLNHAATISMVDLLLGAEWANISVVEFAQDLPSPWSEQALKLLEQLGEEALVGRKAPTSLESIILSCRLNGKAPWLTGRVAPGHVWNAAELFGMSAEEVLGLLTGWVAVLALALPEQSVEQPQGLEREILRTSGYNARRQESVDSWRCHTKIDMPTLWALAEKHRMGASELLVCFSKWQATFGISLPSAELVAAFPEGPQDSDALVLSQNGLPGAAQLTPFDVWQRATERGEEPRQTLERIWRWEKPLGLAHLEMPEDLREPVGRDRTLMQMLNRAGALQRGPLDPFAILFAAEQLEEPVSKILSRLEPYIKPFGLEIPEELYRMP